MGQEQTWDAAAATFDEDADHGLRDPALWARRITDERYVLVSRT